MSKVKFLLLLIGDIELNPGPANSQQIPELKLIFSQRGVKIFHLNVCGLLSKINEISLFLNEHKHTDFLTLSETHINPDRYDAVDGL